LQRCRRAVLEELCKIAAVHIGPVGDGDVHSCRCHWLEAHLQCCCEYT
jgi:hypothetical protein